MKKRALVRLLSDTIDGDRYPLSPRTQTLRAIRAKLRPEPVREPLPPPKHSAPPHCAYQGGALGGNPQALTQIKSKPGPPITLGNAAAARVRLIVWCWDCRHQVEPDAAEMAEHHGAETTVRDWRERVVCSQCGSRRVDMMATETERRT
jgi:hypothetical protein